MGKTDKKQMSEELNEALGLDVDWTKLRTADLVKVYELVSGGLGDAAISIGVQKGKGIAHSIIELAAERLKARLAKG